ncbi:MAG: ABC transporter ATP-binding protein [Peptococcaceae bacterium]|nr:ABC transporter ATP-binding protein [Peptococcaceae bacterium]
MASLSLETVKLSKQFGKFTALNGIDLRMSEGEVFGYIGPNGSGKTTTIRVLLGILQASKGSAKVFGMDAWKDAVEIHKRIAYVPGDVNLWPNLTGGEVIDLFVSLRGKHDKTRREKLLKDFDLEPSKKCRTYSKGNRQKVALVAAFASDADLYILDEPTSGLDPLMEQVFQECVLELKRAGKGIFLSSHIMSEVEKLCDRIAIIREGEIVETGTLAEMRHLTRMTMAIETESPVENLDRLEGVHDVKEQQGGLSFQVDSNKIGSVVSYIGPYGVKKLESSPPTLEDLFMRHYNAEKSLEENTADHDADPPYGDEGVFPDGGE